MKKPKPLAEALAALYFNELNRLQADPSDWGTTSREEQKRHMAAMHHVVKTLGLFGLTIERDNDGYYHILGLDQAPPEPRKQRKILEHGTISPTGTGPTKMSYHDSRRMGYTGGSCGQCGSMRMVPNGTCEKCLECGSTTGCS